METYGNKNEQKVRLITTILIIIFLIIIFTGITYAFFTANNPKGSTAQIISESGKMIITYSDGVGDLLISNDITPSNKIIADKTFTLTGTNTTSGLTMPYKVGIKYNNEFSEGQIHYYIKQISSTNDNITTVYTGTTNQTIPGQTIATGYSHGTLGHGIKYTEMVTGEFPANTDNDSITFNLVLQFPDNGENQDSEKGKKLNATIIINRETPIPTTFANDSWETISEVVSAGDGEMYPIGSEKDVEIEGKNYSVRVVNNTTPEECNTEGFYETACGFVVEFTSAVEQRRMSYGGTSSEGWKGTELRSYANAEFIKKLPTDLQNVIVETKVISDNVTSDTSKIESLDKIYILSIYETLISPLNGITRRLDYYQKIYDEQKTIDYNIHNGWYRSMYTSTDNKLFSVPYASTNSYTGASSDSSYGFIPAFRIGEKNRFKNDSWNTIAINVKNGKSSIYKVGDEKELEINGTSYTVRVANNSSPSECDNSSFSQTACGFVVEFVDIVENKTMNTTDNNIGGWEKSEIRNYSNNEFYKSLPEDLQKLIIPTRVITGHGSTEGEENSETLDKIYIPSLHEIWEGYQTTYDTAYDNTRQLDYYKERKVTSNSDRSLIAKSLNNTNASYWLRTPMATSTNYFVSPDKEGYFGANTATTSLGFAPAFRLGEKDPSFLYDTWTEIADNIKNGKSSVYKIGDEKEVEINGESFTVRLANNSTPDECNTEGFSQSACGFVVEFVDLVENRNVNSAVTAAPTNAGGWKNSEIRTYANKEFFRKLPNDLQKNIISTKIISGHNSSETDNFETTDKIYLLSIHEVFEADTTTAAYDTAYNNTRQLDYYLENNVTSSATKNTTLKKYNGSVNPWWLRNPIYADTNDRVFSFATPSGVGGEVVAASYGFAPAFRIG